MVNDMVFHFHKAYVHDGFYAREQYHVLEERVQS